MVAAVVVGNGLDAWGRETRLETAADLVPLWPRGGRFPARFWDIRVSSERGDGGVGGEVVDGDDGVAGQGVGAEEQAEDVEGVVAVVG